MRVLLAPDKFRGTLTSSEAAAAMARGAAAVGAVETTDEFPMADGGDGTLDVLLRHIPVARVETRIVRGPSADDVTARFLLIGSDAWVETAACSGLSLVTRPEPLIASTFGAGSMILEADRARPDPPGRVIVAVGGTASTDGGTGAARACGWRFLDAAGAELPLGGGGLARLARIDPPAEAPEVALAACDVDVPLISELGSARLFGPQKGAAPADVVALEEGLTRLAGQIESDLGRSVSGLPFAGAGGGMGAGLAAFFDARTVAGFDLVAEATGFDQALRGCDVVVTGEGAYDHQSRLGKVAEQVARRASQADVPCILIAGTVSDRPSGPFALTVDLSERYGSDAARYEAASVVAKATLAALSAIA